MIKQIDIKFLLVALSALTVCVLTVMGVVQEYIYFADPLNEMFFAAIAGVVSIMGFAGIKK